MSKQENKTGILLRAISFAAREHQNQFRKDGTTPYASHPFRVCMILRHVFKVEDEEILAAAVLHDTIEDTTTDRDNLLENFGDKVAGWVSLLSKDKRMREAEREAAYMKQLKTASLPVKLIKLADVYDNLTDTATLPSKGHRAKTIKRTKKYLSALRNKDRALARPLRQIDSLIKKLKD